MNNLELGIHIAPEIEESEVKKVKKSRSHLRIVEPEISALETEKKPSRPLRPRFYDPTTDDDPVAA